MSNSSPFISIVIPCYNEETNIRVGAIENVYDYLKQQKYSWEVIVVDDGSVDGSIELLNKVARLHKDIIVHKRTHQGKAHTVIAGVLKAKGEYILFTDLDQATPLSELNKFIPYLEKGVDVVIGSRDRRREGAPLIRSLMGPGFAFIRSSLIGLHEIKDTQCGFKAFKSETIKKIVMKLRLYKNAHSIKGSNVTAGFDVELLFIARKLGLKIAEVPVKWQYVDTRRVNPIFDSWNGLMDIMRIKLMDIQGKYS